MSSPPTKNKTLRENNSRVNKIHDSRNHLKTLDVGLQYQRNPRKKSTYRKGAHKVRSHTDSLESYDGWASKQKIILEMNHRTHPPTHEAVIKFTRPMKVRDLQIFTRKLRQNLQYLQKKKGIEFAVFYVWEIEKNNCLHLHLLIRTSAKYPRTVLASAIKTYISDKVIRLQHCEAIHSVPAITRYVLKDLKEVRSGKKKILLFKKGLLLNKVGQLNGYFHKPKKQLWEEWKLETFGDKCNRFSKKRGLHPSVKSHNHA